MHPHEEPQLTIPKLPFYIGDGLLVATALAIAVLADWQLSDLQVAYCVVAVALGAALTCLPFIVEYFMRSKEQSEDRIAEIELLKKQLAQAADVFDQFAARQDELESRLSANVESGGAVVGARSEVCGGRSVTRSSAGHAFRLGEPAGGVDTGAA